MFRDFAYITHDYSIRVQDGYLIFRWWRSYVPKDVSEDLSHSDTRLSVMLNGFELHVYNRSELYSRLEKLFGLGSNIFPDDSDENKGDTGGQIKKTDDEDEREESRQRPEAAMARTWRDLIPVIKMDVSSVSYCVDNPRLVCDWLRAFVAVCHLYVSCHLLTPYSYYLSLIRHSLLLLFLSVISTSLVIVTVCHLYVSFYCYCLSFIRHLSLYLNF